MTMRGGKEGGIALAPFVFITLLLFIILCSASSCSHASLYVDASSISDDVVHHRRTTSHKLSNVGNDCIPTCCRLAFATGSTTLLESKKSHGYKQNNKSTSWCGGISTQIQNPTQRCTFTSTRRMLFNMPKVDTYQSPRLATIERRIPSHVMNELKSGIIQFPYEIKTPLPDSISSSTAQQEEKTIILRHLEEKDLNTVVQMCVREFGSYSSSPPPSPNQQLPGVSVEPLSTKTKTPLDTFFDKFENLTFGWVVRTGLTQRIKRRREGYDNQNTLSLSSSTMPDHNVVCLVEQTKTKNDATVIKEENEIVGIAEISLQPPIPQRTAPPYVLPLWIKRILSNFANASPPSPYVSNVLIKDEYRGKGYSKLLMLTCEGLAIKWGFEEVYLHVDADMNSGQVAQGLYTGLGYVGVPDKKANTKYGWIGPEMMNQGLYMVEGVPLLYLRKVLKGVGNGRI